MFLATDENSPHVRYGATFLIASGAFAYGALCNAQVSANVVSDTARAAAIGTNVMMGNIGGVFPPRIKKLTTSFPLSFLSIVRYQVC